MENNNSGDNIREENEEEKEQNEQSKKNQKAEKFDEDEQDKNKLWRNYMKLLTEKCRKLNEENEYADTMFTLTKSHKSMSNKNHCLPLETFPPHNFNQQFNISFCNHFNNNDKFRIKKSSNLKYLSPSKCAKDENSKNEIENNYNNQRELGFARIPPNCPKNMKYILVDRASGENPGLVNGDYLMFMLVSGKGKKIVHLDVCLRGLKGMHISELFPKRSRTKTWKFCFYQAITALLTKTQLRYKYARSGNLDYIYDHAWMLFVHMGFINVKKKQRLNDIVIYNYNYDIELELINELKDIYPIKDVNWNLMDKTVKREQVFERQELMHIPEVIGLGKHATLTKLSPHKKLKKIEDWFDALDMQDTNCIIRTTRFCLAFWKDGLFWYLYNPFRCNEFGFWDDDGSSCIMKFCTSDSLKHHLMILLCRAYSFEDNVQKTDPQSDTELEEDEQKEETKTMKPKPKNEVFTVQIYKMIFHSCKTHNQEFWKKFTAQPKMQIKVKTELNECPEHVNDDKKSCMANETELYFNLYEKERVENINWLNTMLITWSRFSNTMKNKTNALKKKCMWHQYLVEEEEKLYSLWAYIHIKDEIFLEKNRGKQAYACYVICAGMTRLIAPDFWTPETLNSILHCGDSYYSSSILKAELQSQKLKLLNTDCLTNYLSEEFKIGHFLFQVKILPATCGQLYNKYNTCLWSALEQCFLNYQFVILTCENACLGVFKHCTCYYIFDVHSRGPPIFQYGKGTAYLLRATDFYKLLTSLILTIGSSECSQFALNPVTILQIVDFDSMDCREEIKDKKSKFQSNKNKKRKSC